jgi:transposase
MKFSHFVGIDIGKFEILVGVLGADQLACSKAQAFDYTVKGVSAILSLLEETGTCGQLLVLMENTGKYCEKLLAALHGDGHFVWLCSPAVLTNGTLGLNRLKDDPHDARQLALVAKTYQAQALRWEPLTPAVERMSRLWSRRKQLVKDRVRAMNQHTSELDGFKPEPLFLAQLDAQIDLLDEHVKAVECELAALLKTSPDLKRKAAIMTSIPGVGDQISTRVLIITRAFEKIKTPKALASFISSAPFAKTSGTTGRKSRRVSKKGDRRTKSLFYMGVASTALRKDGFWRNEYLRHIEAGHHHNSAINRIINKIINLIFKLVQSDQKFDRKKYIENKQSAIAKMLQLS